MSIVHLIIYTSTENQTNTAQYSHLTYIGLTLGDLCETNSYIPIY